MKTYPIVLSHLCMICQLFPQLLPYCSLLGQNGGKGARQSADSVHFGSHHNHTVVSSILNGFGITQGGGEP